MRTQNAQHNEYNALLQPHLPALNNTALRLTRNEMEAQDLMQETLYKSFRAFHQFQRNTNFKAWVFRILMNNYITLYRKNVRQPQRVSYDDLEDFQIGKFHSVEPDENTGTADMFEDEVKTALQTLPQHFRTVVVLCDVEGLAYHEIAGLISVPLGTVMSRLHRGRKMLKEKLANYAVERGMLTADAVAA